MSPQQLDRISGPEAATVCTVIAALRLERAQCIWSRFKKGRQPMAYRSANDMKSNTKKVSIEILNARLADSIDLALLTKQAHWNIKGPNFIALHELIDGFRATIDGHADTIAERVVQLGGVAMGTIQIVAKDSALEPYPTDIFKGKDHLKALIARYGKTANALRAAIDQTAEVGDLGTSDIFTAYSRDLDKALWFLEAHVQESE
jgi:starvation-inducible DNA-binding protein